MSPANDRHEANVARGLKAAIHNPRVSDEAKEHAKERLEDMGVAVDAEDGGERTSEAKSDTDKDVDELDDASPEPSDTVELDEHERRRLGGYKATLHNPRVSDEAKENAKKVLEDHGAL